MDFLETNSRKFYYSLVGTFRQPFSLLLLAISFILIVTHVNDPTSSIIKQVTNYLVSNERIRSWIIASELKIIGLLVFIPVCFSFSDYRRYYCLIFSLLWVLLVPEHTTFQYVAQAILLRVFIRAKTSDDALRIFVIFLAIVGSLFLGLTDLKLSSISPTPKTKA